MTRRTMVSSAAIVWMMLPFHAASAQDLPVADSASRAQFDTTSATGQSTGAPAQAGSTTFGTGEIIVTARRREESLQKVPLSVVALTGEALQSVGVVKSADLVAIAPSLNVTTTAGVGRNSPSFELRGIGIIEITATQDPTVGIYVNEVYQARPLGTNQTLLDIENVQVLLGPQGTLFGRNSPAGAVLFTTKKPTDRFEGEIATSIGNYDRRDFRGIINIPISESLAVRFAGQRIKRDGYTRDLTTGKDFNDEDNYSLRGSLLYKAGDIENLTVVDYFKTNENGSGGNVSEIVPLPAPPGLSGVASALYPNIGSLLAEQRARGPFKVRYTPGADYHNNTKAYGISNTTTIGIGDDFTLKNIFAYRKTAIDSMADSDGSFAAILDASGQTNRGKQFSEELQLQYAREGLNAIIGLYYLHDDATEASDSGFLVGALDPTAAVTGVRTNTRALNKSAAVFAQATYELFDGLSITAGGRYTWDRRRATYAPRVFDTICALAPALNTDGDCNYTARAKFSKATYNVSLDYQLTPDKLVYVAHRRGYRSGGFDPRATTEAQTVPFRPEIVNDIEIGFKGDWDLGGDARLRTNIAAYQTWYNDIQRGVIQVSPAGGVQTVVRNAAKAKIKGLEFSGVLTPVRGFNITGYLGYVDAKHTNFDLFVTPTPPFPASVVSPGPVGATCGDTLITPADAGTTVSCRNVPFGVAKYSYGVGANLTPVDTPEFGQLTFSANYSYRGPFSGKNDLPFLTGRAEAQHLMNAAINWNSIGGSGFSGQLWMRNVFNEAYSEGILTLQTSLGNTLNYYAPPRMYGVDLKYNF